MGLGWLVASFISDDAVRLMVGVIGVAFVANVWLGSADTTPKTMGITSGMFWGGVSGFTSFMTRGGGPPFQVYVLPQRLPKLVLVGTTTMFFAVVNAMKIVPYFMLGQFHVRQFLTSVALLPVAIAANHGRHLAGSPHPDRVFYRSPTLCFC